jgi:hypothetical protein
MGDFRELFQIPVGTGNWGTDCEGPAYVNRQYLIVADWDEAGRTGSRWTSITPRWAHYTGWYRFTVLDPYEAEHFLGAVGPGDGAYYYTLRQRDWEIDVRDPDDPDQP